jgi:hypothetical protein
MLMLTIQLIGLLDVLCCIPSCRINHEAIDPIRVERERYNVVLRRGFRCEHWLISQIIMISTFLTIVFEVYVNC